MRGQSIRQVLCRRQGLVRPGQDNELVLRTRSSIPSWSVQFQLWLHSETCDLPPCPSLCCCTVHLEEKFLLTNGGKESPTSQRLGIGTVQQFLSFPRLSLSVSVCILPYTGVSWPQSCSRRPGIVRATSCPPYFCQHPCCQRFQPRVQSQRSHPSSNAVQRCVGVCPDLSWPSRK